MTCTPPHPVRRTVSLQRIRISRPECSCSEIRSNSRRLTIARLSTPSGRCGGRAAASRFDGGESWLSLDGDVFSSLIGADMERGRLLAGVAVSHTRGDGELDLATPYPDRTDVEASLTSVYPYVRYVASDRLSVWAALGYGEGDYEQVRDASGNPVEAEIGMKLGAFGTRTALFSAAETGWYHVAVKSDAYWMEIQSDPKGNFATSSLEATRLRLALEGWCEGSLPSGALLWQSAELAVRHDGGDVEEGIGLELGGRLRYTDRARGFAVEAAAQGLLAHQDSSFQDWGAGVSFRYDPCVFCLPGFGPSLRIAPSWGSASNGSSVLWSRHTIADLVTDEGSDPRGRLDVELSYGMGALDGQGLFTPYAGLSLADGATRTTRLGGRLRLDKSRLTFNVEGAHHERRDRADEQTLLLNLYVY